jgi:hypothetical protein
MKLKLYKDKKDVIENNVRLGTGYLLTTYLDEQFCEEKYETTLSFPFIVWEDESGLWVTEKGDFIIEDKEEFIRERRITEAMYEAMKDIFDSLGEDND